MKYSSKLRLAAALSLAFVALHPAQAADKHLTVLMAVPGLDFPFFVHMVDQAKDQANKTGGIDLIVGDGQRSSTKETADVEAAISKGVDGIIISPNDVDASGAGDSGSGRRQNSGRYRRPACQQGSGHTGACRRRQR